MAQGSARVVLTALAGNGAIALAKFVAAAISGSTAMLTEAIHSLVDTGDQLLLLVGQARGRRPPDETHPLGYGMEAYFWSFIVALMVFVLGGLLSVYEGVRHILHPEPVVSPWISLGVLAVSAVFEGLSFRVGYREYKRVVRGAPIRLWAFIRNSKDAGMVSVLLEDSAALVGIVLAAAGVIASGFFHIAWADGAASVAIGLLLACVAFVLANETRSLIAGESVAPIVMERLKETLDAINCITRLDEIATLHLGPGAILVALTLTFRPKATSTSIDAAILEITQCLQATDGRVAYVYVRPSHTDEAPAARAAE
ncbi:MAG TPA: cation diffusion facilitator family transporter [Phenylobacterium sp.]|jgi:cation diffusion facilitator family transporter|uniref:cation diffusion facilitator family transporter n=1 Tax=Phenylobacterium sp. TaxID=1871053 RepID=UPI002C626E66|nr:cation diffusion facilitator family transporter [Phenylobacterium sp.]HXA40988.1 cation diffusion facilitator family transporter [Phenylobacterium sp.]